MLDTSISSVALINLLMLLLFCSKVKAAVDSECQQSNFSDSLGTEQYFLYGLTADCDIFLTTSNVSGDDLTTLLGPQPLFPHNATRRTADGQVKALNCENDVIHLIRDFNNVVKVLLITRAKDGKIYARIYRLTGPIVGESFTKIKYVDCEEEPHWCQLLNPVLSGAKSDDVKAAEKDNSDEQRSSGEEDFLKMALAESESVAPASSFPIVQRYCGSFVDAVDTEFYLLSAERRPARDGLRVALHGYTLGYDDDRLVYASHNRRHWLRESYVRAERGIEDVDEAKADRQANRLYLIDTKKNDGRMFSVPLRDAKNAIGTLYSDDGVDVPVLNGTNELPDQFQVANGRFISLIAGNNSNDEGEDYGGVSRIVVRRIAADFASFDREQLCVGMLVQPSPSADLYPVYNNKRNVQIAAIVGDHYQLLHKQLAAQETSAR